MCDCFHLAFPNWHAASSGTAGRRLHAPEPATEDDSICEEPTHFAEEERPRPQGSSPVQEYPEAAKYTDDEKQVNNVLLPADMPTVFRRSVTACDGGTRGGARGLCDTDSNSVSISIATPTSMTSTDTPVRSCVQKRQCKGEHDPDHKAGNGHKGKKSGLGSIFERTSTPKMSKSKEAHSPEGGVIVNTAKDGCAEGLVYGGGGKEGIFIKKIVPESPASKSLKVKEGDQILSATVYFDNMSYEDAIQILEHAQAYNLKLCLKRHPDIPETEPTIESDVMPQEEEVFSTETREQGKTRRRGDARISWPKFPSFGKGRKSRFTRSHSSSEADDQKKLELSPTTSDTESPIKSQDALKGKKKHRIKLSALTKRGRISSSEDQDTDAPTTGQMSSDIQQKQESDTLSPEFPEYSIAETPEVNVQADKKAGDVLETDQIQHKVELISIDTTLKTTDLTVALADQESQSGTPKSPDKGKKKKERSELKMKILGKDKLHKKEAKAKSSPKRLKTLGASVDADDPSETGKSAVISSSESKTKLLGDQPTVDVNNKIQSEESSKVISSKSMTSQISLPKVELDITVRKSPKKVNEKTQKGKDIKQKQSKKSSPKHKQPEMDISLIATSEDMQKVNDQESITITGHVSTTQLPKREDIEIPGMEDMSMITTTTRMMEPKADFKKRTKESQAETVQMSIDVDSVKEAVSKLPGFKLPQVDVSGVPIPEEITVIDANAQRISVKTPTKVAKPKQEEHLNRSDITASSEISKTIFLTENRIDFKKSQKEDKTSPTMFKQDIVISNKEVSILQEKEFDRTNGKGDLKIDSESEATKESLKTSIRPRITMPSFGMSSKSRRLPYIGIDMHKQSFIQAKELETETMKDETQTGEVICKVKIPELDGIEYIDSVDELSVKKDIGLTSTELKTTSAISLKTKEKCDEPEDVKNKLSKVGITPSNTPSGKEDLSDEGTTKPLVKDGKNSFKWPNLDISVPKFKGTADINTSKKDTAVTEAQAKGGLIPGGPKRDVIHKSSDIYAPKEMAKDEKSQVKTQGEFDWQESKFAKLGIKTPKTKGPEFDLTLSKEIAHDTLSHDEAQGPLPEPSKMHVTPGKENIYFLKQKMQLEKPGVEVKPLQTKGEHVQGGKIKIPNLGNKTTKLTSPEINISSSKKDAEFFLPEAKLEVKLTEVSTTDVNKDIFGPEEKKGIEKSDLKIKTQPKEGEEKGQGHKIKMPQLGIVLPEVTMHKSDLSLSKKDKDLRLPEVKGEIKDHEVKGNGSLTTQDVRAPGIKVESIDFEGSSSKFKMPSFKMPRFGAATPNLSSEVSDTHSSEDGAAIDTLIPDTDVGPSTDVKTKASEIDGTASKFKIPTFGISTPKLKGPGTDTTVSKKVVDVDVLKGEAELKLLHAEHKDCGIRLKGKTPQIGDVEYSGSKPKITMPFSEAKTEVKLSQVDGHKIDFSIPVALKETPELEIQTLKTESQLDGQEGKTKLSKIGIEIPKIKGPEFQLGLSSKNVDVVETKDKVDLLPDTETKVEIPIADVSLGTAEILIPTRKVEVGRPEVQTQPIVEGQRARFKMPKFGITMPKVKGPETKKDVEGTLTDSKTEIKIPDANFEVQHVEQSPSKSYMPTFKLPKLGLGTASVTHGIYASEKNVQGDGIEKDISDEVLAVTIVEPSTDMEGPSIDIKTIGAGPEGKTHKFKMQSLGLSVPQIKGHETDVVVTQQNTKAEEKLKDAEQKKIGVEKDTKVTDISVIAKDKPRSQGKFKMPTLKLPNFGVGISTTKEDDFTVDKDVIVDGANIKIPEANVTISSRAPRSDIEGKSMDVKMTEMEQKDKEIKSKLPSLGLSGTDIDLGLSNIEVDANILEGKAEVTLQNDDLNKYSIKEETSAPEIKVLKKEKEGSPSRFKLPTFKLPKFGLSAQSSTEEVPHLNKDDDTGGNETKTSGEIHPVSTEGPSIDIKDSSLDLKTTGTVNEGRGRKFKLPSLGFSLSQTKGPDTEITVSTIDVNITVPEVKTEIKVPEEKFDRSSEVEAKATEFKDIKMETEGSPSKFKMPTFKLPKFGLSAQSSTEEVPPFHKDVKTGGGETAVSGEILAASIEGPSIDITRPSAAIETKGTENEGKGRKFKLPSLGFSASQTKGPDTETSLSTTDVDVTVQEMKTEIKLPQEKFNKSFEVEANAPEFKGIKMETEGSPSKFKMPTFKLPKFGLSAQSSTEEVPPLDKDVKTGGGETAVSGEILAASIEGPSIDITRPSAAIETKGTENEGKGRKFKLPSLGFLASQTKRPDTETSLSTTDVDITVQEMKTEIKLPEEKFNKSFEVEANAPEFKGIKMETEESPSKFKMPAFKLPKFGLSAQSSKDEVPPLDKDVKTGGGETAVSGEILAASIEGPSIDITRPSAAIETKGTENEGKGRKFKLPSLGFSASQTKRPDTEMSLSTTDVDVTVQEMKTEIKLPEEKFNKSFEVEDNAPEFKGIKMETEGSPSKFKMPTFKLPKFGLSAQSSTEEVPPLDKDVQTGGGETAVSGEILAASIEGPSIDITRPSAAIETKGTENEGKGRKFKLPSLGFSASQTKRPDTETSLSTTDVDITVQEMKTEIKLPEEKFNKSFEAEANAPEFKGIKMETEGSPSKFKMPAFKFPKFGLSAQSSTEEVPPLVKDIKISGGETTKSEEVKIPDDELKRIETEKESKGAEVEVVAKGIDGSIQSTSKFKMPIFKFPKFGLATQSSTEDVPSFEKDVKTGGGETTASEEVLTVATEGSKIEIKGASVDLNIVESEHEGRGRKFKLPSLSFSVPQAKEPDTDLSLKTDVDVSLPEVKAEVKFPDDKLNNSVEVEIKALENKDIRENTEGSPSKYKMPSFKLPKFGLVSTEEVPPLYKGVKPVEGETTTSEDVIAVTTEAPTIEIMGLPLQPKTEGSDRDQKGKKFKLPSLGFSVTEAKGAFSDLGQSHKDVDVTLTEVKAEIKLPDVEDLKKSSTAIEIKGPEIKTVTKETDGSPSKVRMPAFKLPKFGLATQSDTGKGPPLDKGEDGERKITVTPMETKATEITVVSKDIDGSPSKFKMPTFKLPKFGLATQSSNKQVPALDKDVKTVKGESTTLEEVLTLTTEGPSIEIKGPSMDLKSSETDNERGSKFKLPRLGFSTAQAKGSDTNISLSKTGAHVTVPEVKAEVPFSDAKMKQPLVQMDVKSPEIKAHSGDIEAISEVEMPKITLPKFGAVTPHLSMEIPNVNKEKRIDVERNDDIEPVDVIVGVTSTETKIGQSDATVNESSTVSTVEAFPAPELDTNLKKSKFSLPKFSFSKSSMKEPEIKADLPDNGVKIEHAEAELITEVKLSADDKNDLTVFETTASEAEVKSKDVKRSPSKFKMPTLKMPRFGSASPEVTTETNSTDKIAEGDGSHLGEGPTVSIKGPKTDVKTDASKSVQPDNETLNTESDSAVHGSPSKFKLPAFKIPRLGLSRSKPEEEFFHNEHKNIEDQLEIKTELKEENISSKLTLTSFGDILKSIDVDFDVRKVDKVDPNLETSKEPHEPVEPTTEAKSRQDATKSTESSGWFKFPKFGLSSPTEQQKIPDKVEHTKDSSPVGETKDEEVSPTFSVQSSDAYADISSTITSEPVGPFIPSPTKVTVKYSDEIAAAQLEEMHSDIMTSTTRTELIADVPDLPEKITILSSGVSSSSEDTVRLKSGKIHIITSNIQATPESQHARLLSAVQVQSGEGLALQSEADEAPSWTVQDAQSTMRTVKHLIQETSTERSESKETLVITKQITHIFGPTEPISGETASSIQRLKDSVHSDKMKFFDEAEK